MAIETKISFLLLVGALMGPMASRATAEARPEGDAVDHLPVEVTIDVVPLKGDQRRAMRDWASRLKRPASNRHKNGATQTPQPSRTPNGLTHPQNGTPSPLQMPNPFFPFLQPATQPGMHPQGIQGVRSQEMKRPQIYPPQPGARPQTGSRNDSVAPANLDRKIAEPVRPGALDRPIERDNPRQRPPRQRRPVPENRIP